MILDSHGRPLRRRPGFFTGYDAEPKPLPKPPRAPGYAIGSEAPKKEEDDKEEE